MIKKNGFTLVEVLVVASITGFITTFLLVNFSRTRINFIESTQNFIARVRIAQDKANQSALYNGDIRCGYGIKYLSNQSFGVYVGENSSTTDCSLANKDYNPSGDPDNDVLLETINFADSRVEFKNTFRAIFFEPPDPSTYIVDSSGVVHGEPNYTQQIVIGRVGVNCPTDCKTVYVSTSGKIE